MAFYSPLRYPGGKGDLANFFKLVYLQNNLNRSPYVEIYAGGAGIALSLLLTGYTNEIIINDLDRSVYAFWYSVLNETDHLCELIKHTPITMDEWYRQKGIQVNANDQTSLLELGFSTFFLNRTNRSGIIKGGVIGGKSQEGKYFLDARFNKKNLESRILNIARNRARIRLYNLDASEFINTVLPTIPRNGLVYLDPPYYVKGQGLYTNYYEHTDHEEISRLIPSIEQHWIVSYDNVPQIQQMYTGFSKMVYGLSYSATERYKGSEIMFFSDGLVVPGVESPANIQNKTITKVAGNHFNYQIPLPLSNDFNPM